MSQNSKDTYYPNFGKEETKKYTPTLIIKQTFIETLLFAGNVLKTIYKVLLYLILHSPEKKDTQYNHLSRFTCNRQVMPILR
jgi:hypothetical protein